jgi:hypothetical protein
MPPETQFDGFQCEICGQFHAGQYISIACDSPDPYAWLTEKKRTSAHLGTDDCVIDDAYYLRGIVELPIVGLDEVFLWGVWARVWQRDYEEFGEHYSDEGREKMIGPYKGRINNKLAGYDPSTQDLKCAIKIQPVGARPLFIIEEPEHPLAIEQRNGISLERARRISAMVRHEVR